jgi:hypothetical protein
MFEVYLSMIRRKHYLAIFSFLLLYVWESLFILPIDQKHNRLAENPDSGIIQSYPLNAVPLNTEEKSLKTWKYSYHWITRLTAYGCFLSSYDHKVRGIKRFISYLNSSEEILPNLTIRIKIFPFHNFL